jgi:uroporphyrinogen-III synthase
MTNDMNQKQAFSSLALLNSKKILICRPEPSASELSTALEAMGARCQKLPMLTIKPVEISEAERQCILNLDQYQHVIVTSQHAAQMGIEEIDTYWPQAPIEQKWYAIGRKTAAILGSSSLDLYPPKQDMTSEELLKNEALESIEGERVLVLKGEGGRETLIKELNARNAKVDTISFYSRKRPEYPAKTLISNILDFDPDFIIALSGETLTNLIDHCKAHNIDLLERSFILSSNRVANIAYDSGIKNVLIPENLMPMDIVRCIKKAK